MKKLKDDMSKKENSKLKGLLKYYHQGDVYDALNAFYVADKYNSFPTLEISSFGTSKMVIYLGLGETKKVAINKSSTVNINLMILKLTRQLNQNQLRKLDQVLMKCKKIF